MQMNIDITAILTICIHLVLIFIEPTYGLSTRRLHISNINQPYREIDWSNHNECNANSLMSNVPIWIAPYTMWINFHGCFEGQVRGGVDLQEESLPLIDHKDNHVQACYVHCRFSSFVFINTNCICLVHVSLTDRSCTPVECKHDSSVFCSENTTCMCHYEPVSIPELSQDIDDGCVAVRSNSDRTVYQSKNCSDALPFLLCKEKLGRYTSVDHSFQAVHWKDAIAHCARDKKTAIYNNKKITAAITAAMKAPNNLHWIAVFRKKFQIAEEMCPVVTSGNNRHDYLIKTRRNCSDSLQFICQNVPSEPGIPSAIPTTYIDTTKHRGGILIPTNVQPDDTSMQPDIASMQPHGTTTQPDDKNALSDDTGTQQDETNTQKDDRSTTLQRTYSVNSMQTLTSQTIGIIVGIVSGVIILTITVVIIVCKKKKYKKNGNGLNNGTARNVHETSTQQTQYAAIVRGKQCDAAGPQNEGCSNNVENNGDDRGHYEAVPNTMPVGETSNYDTMAIVHAENGSNYGRLKSKAKLDTEMSDYDTMANIRKENESGYGILQTSALTDNALSDYDTMANLRVENEDGYGVVLTTNHVITDYDTMENVRSKIIQE